LRKAVEARKAATLFRTTVKKLVANDNKEVLGILATDRRGRDIYVRARKAVILASGGFSYNKEMRRIFRPDLMEAVSYCAPGLTGDGIRMAWDLGATLENMSNAYRVNLVAKVTAERGALVLPLLTNPCILVNKNGKRFVSEDAFYEYLAAALLKQEGRYGFIVFDEAVRKKGMPLAYGFSRDLRPELEAGIAKKAETVGELAKLLGMDAAALQGTIDKVNADAKLGRDSEFGRQKEFGAVDTAPYYAVEVRTGLSDTVGGLKTNLRAQVVDVFGEVIPRLYAAGSTTDGWMFKMYPGSGTYIGNALNFGRIAANNAVAEKALG